MITTDLTSADLPLARPLLDAAAQERRPLLQDRLLALPASPDVRGAGGSRRRRACRSRGARERRAASRSASTTTRATSARRCGTSRRRWTGSIPDGPGYYFDPRHAVAEGGGGAWKAATHLVAPRLKMVAVKDCVWREGGDRAGASRTVRSAKGSSTGTGSGRGCARRDSADRSRFTWNTTSQAPRPRSASIHAGGGASRPGVRAASAGVRPVLTGGQEITEIKRPDKEIKR